MTINAPTRPLYLLNRAFEDRAATFLAAGELTAADLLIVDAVAPRFGESDPTILLGLALAVRAPRAGDVGVFLSAVKTMAEPSAEPDSEVALSWPEDCAAWEAAVLASPMVGGPEDVGLPFVRQPVAGGDLLMTRRMWREQERLAQAITRLATSAPALTLSEEVVTQGLSGLFDDVQGQGARAVKAAATRRLTVVTGGPGTGKTYSIKRLLALLLEAADDPTKPLRVALGAPTGKAAVRMAEAIAEELSALKVSDRVREALATLKPLTLHKLIGARPDGTYRHGVDNPIAADLVVIDEASMVDLALMRQLFEAIPDGARLVLLGDRDQLASVDAGCVLADMVGPVLDDPDSVGSPLHGSVIPFTFNHRFKSAPTVAAIAQALQRRDDTQLDDVDKWMSGEVVAEGEQDPHRIRYLGAPKDGRPTPAQLDALAAPHLEEYGFIGMLAQAIDRRGPHSRALSDPEFHSKLLEALDRYRVLAVHRRGPLGVSGLERALVQRCRGALSSAISGKQALPSRGGHWLGRPVMVTRNSYEVGLMNGDIGLVLPTKSGLAVVFPPKKSGNPPREISISRLPEHMGALAMTVHKSQGSQFKRVAIVLAGRDSPIQTRELIYTAITRTSSLLDWLGDRAELRRALERRVGRASGLGQLLWDA